MREPGFIDALAWHSDPKLLVIELKTEIVEANELRGVLDRKIRLAPRTARVRGWLPLNASICGGGVGHQQSAHQDACADVPTGTPHVHDQDFRLATRPGRRIAGLLVFPEPQWQELRRA